MLEVLLITSHLLHKYYNNTFYISSARYKFGFDLEPLDACARVQNNHFINGLEPIRCKTDEKIGLCQFIVPCPALVPQTSSGAALMCRPAFLDAV